MYLHEEYIRRKKLRVPTILYKRRSSVILKTSSPPYRWRIVALCWHAPDRHPGFFELRVSEPVHNSHDRGTKTMRDLKGEDVCYWDQYEETVLTFAEDSRKQGFAAVEGPEQLLAAGQIFLMIYDAWLARTMEPSFLLKVGEMLDESRTVADRLTALDGIIAPTRSTKSVHETWVYQLSPLAHAGSEWLVRLING
jgi:hypothetical protein